MAAVTIPWPQWAMGKMRERQSEIILRFKFVAVDDTCSMTPLSIHVNRECTARSRMVCRMPSALQFFAVDNLYLRVITSIRLKLPPSPLVNFWLFHKCVPLLVHDVDTFVGLALTAKCQHRNAQLHTRNRCCRYESFVREWHTCILLSSDLFCDLCPLCCMREWNAITEITIALLALFLIPVAQKTGGKS